jgi:hypothetical protein
MKYFLLFIFIVSHQFAGASVKDYEYLPFLDENFKIGLGMSYSKLESNSDLGNYYLLSNANPRFESSYSSPIKQGYRHKYSIGFVQELYRPENESFTLKTRDARISSFIAWQPIWVSNSKTFTRHFKFSLKNGSVISEIPNILEATGDVGDRYSVDVGVGFNWYGLTVSKFPMSVDAEVLYSQTLFDNSVNSVYSGLTYRMGFEFEFKKRSVFSGWGMRGFYEYEDIKNDYSKVVDKELGIIFSKAFVF